MDSRGHLKINVKAFLFFFKICPKYWIVFFVVNFLIIFDSFYDLFIMSNILNQFNVYINFDNIFYLLVKMIIIKFIINVLIKILSHYETIYLSEFNHRENIIFVKKFLNIEYSEMEKADFRQLRRTVAESSNFGYGRFCFINTLKDIINTIFTIGVSSFLFIKLIIEFVVTKATVTSYLLFAVLFVFIIIRVLYNRYNIKKMSEVNSSMLNKYVDNNRIEDSFNSYNQGKDIRMYKQNKYILDIKNKIYCSWIDIFKTISKLQFKFSVPHSIITHFQKLLTFSFFAQLVFLGHLHPGSFFSYIGYTEKFIESVCSINDHISLLKNNTMHIDRYLSVFEYREHKKNDLSVKIIKNKINSITFNNVSFKYPDCDFYALKNISVNINKGKKYAVVGQNGSGKSTFIKLLCNLYEPENGTICINNINVNEFDLNEYWTLLSVIFQDFSLFSFSLGQNIAVNETIDENKLESIIDAVGFHERYINMEKGIDTLLYKNFDEKGVEISGGEAQKIALARAIYKDGEIFILDEPTAALDPIAESELYDNFNKIVQDKTVIYISHRLASCKFCDEIIVFDKGQIVQVGTHENLLKDSNGKYYELWHAQAEHYNL